MFLKALGWTEEQILEEFGEFESMRATLEKDTVKTQDEALLDIYRKLRPGEPPTKEAAQNLIENLLGRIAKKELDVVIDKTFPLSEAAAAHRYIEDRKAFGRVLLTP